MTALDWSPIIQAFIAAIALTMTSLIAIFVPRGIAAFEARTGIELSAQQQATVMGAALTAKGIIETKLHQGAMQLAEITPNNPVVVAEAAAAIARVPNAAKAMDKSVPSMAETIVGLVDTKSAAQAMVTAPVSSPDNPIPVSAIGSQTSANRGPTPPYPAPLVPRI